VFVDKAADRAQGVVVQLDLVPGDLADELSPPSGGDVPFDGAKEEARQLTRSAVHADGSGNLLVALACTGPRPGWSRHGPSRTGQARVLMSWPSENAA
jgi:hypothetical protein